MRADPPVAEERPPWERQAGESDRAFEVFALYRDMGPRRRSLLGVCELLKPSGTDGGPKRVSAWGRVRWWAERWSWTERAAAYDAAQDRRRREREEAIRAEARERHLATARRLQDFGATVLARALELEPELAAMNLARYKVVLEDKRSGKRAETDRKGLAEVLPLALDALKEGIGLERLIYGEPSSIRVEITEEQAQALLVTIQQHVPTERWNEVADALEGVFTRAPEALPAPGQAAEGGDGAEAGVSRSGRHGHDETEGESPG